MPMFCGRCSAAVATPVLRGRPSVVLIGALGAERAVAPVALDSAKGAYNARADVAMRRLALVIVKPTGH